MMGNRHKSNRRRSTGLSPLTVKATKAEESNDQTPNSSLPSVTSSSSSSSSSLFGSPLEGLSPVNQKIVNAMDKRLRMMEEKKQKAIQQQMVNKLKEDYVQRLREDKLIDWGIRNAVDDEYRTQALQKAREMEQIRVNELRQRIQEKDTKRQLNAEQVDDLARKIVSRNGYYGSSEGSRRSLSPVHNMQHRQQQITQVYSQPLRKSFPETNRKLDSRSGLIRQSSVTDLVRSMSKEQIQSSESPASSPIRRTNSYSRHSAVHSNQLNSRRHSNSVFDMSPTRKQSTHSFKQRRSPLRTKPQPQSQPLVLPALQTQSMQPHHRTQKPKRREPVDGYESEGSVSTTAEIDQSPINDIESPIDNASTFKADVQPTTDSVNGSADVTSDVASNEKSVDGSEETQSHHTQQSNVKRVAFDDPEKVIVNVDD